MKENDNIVMKFPKQLLILDLSVIAIFAFIMIIVTICTPSPHIAMYIAMSIFIIIPATLVALMLALFKIEVKGTKISVRKKLGFSRYSFDISDIKYLNFCVTETDFGENEIITIETNKGQKIKLEKIMTNSDKVIEYLDKYVDESKKVKEKKTKRYKDIEYIQHEIFEEMKISGKNKDSCSAKTKITLWNKEIKLSVYVTICDEYQQYGRFTPKQETAFKYFKDNIEDVQKIIEQYLEKEKNTKDPEELLSIYDIYAITFTVNGGFGINIGNDSANDDELEDFTVVILPEFSIEEAGDYSFQAICEEYKED